MKYIFAILLLSSLIHADEMQRIEAIVQDITKLRAQYASCEKELKSQKQTTHKQLLEIDLMQEAYTKEQEYKDKIAKLEKLVKNQEKLLKSKEYKIKTLKVSKINNMKIKEKSNKSLKKKEKNIKNLGDFHCDKANKFPKLKLKKKYEKEVVNVSKKLKNNTQKIKKVKASTYRVLFDTNVYDAIDGRVLQRWEKNRSFTSDIKSENWVKVTGYFVNRVWKKAENDIWLQASDVKAR